MAFSYKKIVTWSIFTEEMIAHYEDTKRKTFFSQLINIKQKRSVVEHIEDFQKLNIRVNNIPEEHRIDVFIQTLKDSIQHEVLVWEPDSLERHSDWQEKLNVKLWRQGILPLTSINMEVLLLLDFHKVQVDTTKIGRKKRKMALL